MKNFLLLLLVLTLTACDGQVWGPFTSPPPKTYYYDKCTEAVQFQACLNNAPAGPVASKYNDWDEVVHACRATAYGLSERATPTNIPAACLDTRTGM